MAQLLFELHDAGGVTRREVAIGNVIVAGWTGRDEAAVRHHIDELAAIGVPPPSAVPVYYRVAASLLTQDPQFQVLGAGSSGEAEPVLFATEDGVWLTLGSDHTDRDAERSGVALSKQLCPKPVARTAWRWNDVREHADALELRAWIDEAGHGVEYQRGTLAAVRPLDALVAGCPAGELGPGTMMFCGTLAAIGGVRASPAFRAELRDPRDGRTITLAYEARALPVVA